MKSSFSTELFLLLMYGVFGAETEEVKSVTVKEGDSVTLNPERNQIQGIIKIVWRFGDKGIIIADSSENDFGLSNTDERFRDRLQLNETGSLTIKNMRTKHSGLYVLQIDRNTGPSYMKFNVTVLEPGRSSGAIAGTCVTVLLVAAAAVVYYYRHRICDLKRLMEPEISEQMLNENEDTTAEQLCKKYEEKILSVMEGESVTLKIDAEIKGDDQILWMFGPQETLIAEIKSETREITTFDGIDGRFKDKLKLVKTASLTITNITAEHSGVYKLQTSSSRGTSFQRFIVNVKVMIISVVEGQSVTLYPDNTGAQKDDLIVWMFGDENNLIAQMTGKTRATYEGTDGIFRDRLKLDKRTGSLTIRNMRTEQSGLYKLQMSSSSKGTTNKRFNIVINLNNVSVKEGEALVLKTNAEIRKKDTILWLFGDENTLIAEINEGNGNISTFDGVNERFGGSLGLDISTGSLTIRNITTEHTGVYKQKVISKKGTTIKRINVAVRVRMILGVKGKYVTLNPDIETQRDDLFLWMFGDENNLIAQLTGETKETTYTDADERFGDGLRLDKNTGSLTIKNITAGPYKLRIVSSRRNLNRKFRVFICCESGPKIVSAMVGESLILITDFTIERGERVQWSFQDKTLAAGMNGDISKTAYGDVRFKDRLELHHQTGSLTIKNTRTSDTGDYQLKFLSRSGKVICWEFKVTVSDSTMNRSAIVLMNEGACE
uniref:Immunoglobulin domain-containing protein n=1 Tax=Cyprinus carpio TaxID=7962 RepID=A0A8C2C4W3_CYPCA